MQVCVIVMFIYMQTSRIIYEWGVVVADTAAQLLCSARYMANAGI